MPIFIKWKITCLFSQKSATKSSRDYKRYQLKKISIQLKKILVTKRQQTKEDGANSDYIERTGNVKTCFSGLDGKDTKNNKLRRNKNSQNRRYLPA